MDISTEGFSSNAGSINQGPIPYVTNLRRDIIENNNYFTALWTGRYIQVGLMTVPVNGKTGLDMRINTDQIYYVEQGAALVTMGMSQEYLNFQLQAYSGFSIFVPAGTWRNIFNIGKMDLKMSLTISPPFLPYDTNFKTGKDWIPSVYY